MAVVRRQPRSTDRWLAAAERVENVLLRIAVICLLLLVVGQTLLSTDARTLLSYVYRLEGVAYDPREVVEPKAVGALYLSREGEPVRTVTLVLVSGPAAPEVRLLVNGYAVADFGHPTVAIQVHPGDRLEIDARASARPVRVRVVDVADDLDAPREGQEIEAAGAVVPLGVVERR